MFQEIEGGCRLGLNFTANFTNYLRILAKTQVGENHFQGGL